MVPLLLFTIFCALGGVSSKKCRTNNDCDSGRCEWRRCVGQLGRMVSGRKEAKACYEDHDCVKGELCRNGLCKPRQPLMRKLSKGPYECIGDEDCPEHHKCGHYKKCYDMRDKKYVEESFMHIPCQGKKDDFCPTITGYEDSICSNIVYRRENVSDYICMLPPPFEIYDTISCDANGNCPRYCKCIHKTCFQPFWRTVRERCTSDDQCTYRATCNKTLGQCKMSTEWYAKFMNCRTSKDCNSDAVLRKKCTRFECWYRRAMATECTACSFDDFCDNSENCLRVQRQTDFDCGNDNWFYWSSAFYCAVKQETTFSDAQKQCKDWGAELAYPPDRGTEKDFIPERAFLAYLAVRNQWVVESTNGIEKKFVDWTKKAEQGTKSPYICKKEVHRSFLPNNATTFRGQKCQTSFIYRNKFCYIGGFTNFMPRFAVRTVCTLLDSEIVEIKNKEEARAVYGLAGGKSFWLGLKKEKRDWYWDGGNFGHRAHFFFWRTGQPHTQGGKNCVYSPYAGEWMSADCDKFNAPKVYICKRPAFTD